MQGATVGVQRKDHNSGSSGTERRPGIYHFAFLHFAFVIGRGAPGREVRGVRTENTRSAEGLLATRFLP